MGVKGSARLVSRVSQLLAVSLVLGGLFTALPPVQAAPPTVILWVPNTGSSWTGNTSHAILWWQADDNDFNLTVWINYSTNGGGSWTPIPGAQGVLYPTGNNSFPWLVPCTNTVRAVVRVTAIDSGGGSTSAQSGLFEIDCWPPWAYVLWPTDGQTDVPLDALIQLGFSENMNNITTEAGFVISPPTPGSFLWPSPRNLTFTPSPNLSPCTNYSVALRADIVTDDSNPGNFLDGDFDGVPEGSPTDDVAWGFRTVCGGDFPPSITLLVPAGGEDWTGGSVRVLSWSAWDAEDAPVNLSVDLEYSVGGLPWTTIAMDLPGNMSSYPWTVPLVDTTTARVRACVTDTANQTTCDISPMFTVDSTAPAVSTVPPNNATGVPVTITLVATFLENMNVAAGTVDTAPMIPLSVSWTSPTSLTIQPTTPLQTCTVYTIYLVGFTDDSDPGNPLDYLWSFTTHCPVPPGVTLVSPVGGEYWAGGSSQLIQWVAMDDSPLSQLTFFVNYTSSAQSGTIAGPLVGVTSFAWAIPPIDATDVVVDVTVVDAEGLIGWDQSGVFTIDSTPPALSTYGPTGWDIALGTTADAFFSETVSAMMNLTAESFGLRDEGLGSWVPVTWVRVPPSPFLREFHFVPDTPLRSCGDYRAFVNGTFFDRAGLRLTNPVDWAFHTICAPTVALSSPSGREDWSGGTSHDVAWTMSDEVASPLFVYLNYSLDGGIDGYPYPVIAGPRAVGPTTEAWTLPLEDSDRVRLRIVVIDPSGLTAMDESGTFTIDSTPPGILASIPANGARGVKITDDLQVVFDEPIVQSSVAFTIAPDPGGVSFSWTVTGLGLDVLVIRHSPLRSRTDYTLTFETTLRDDSDPGNHPATPLQVLFSTKPPPNVNPPVAKAVGKHQVRAGEMVTLDGSGSTGTITRYVWTIADNQNRIVDVLVGRIVVYAFQNHGRHHVTLRVEDASTGLADEDTLEITVTSNSNALIGLSFVAVLGAAAILGGTEVGRVTLMMLFATVAPRKRNGKEEAETRGMIRGYLRVHPGDTYTAIKVNLGLNDGTLTWHLMKLGKEGIVKAQTQGTHRCYYLAGMPPPLENGGELYEIQRRMIHVVKRDPGMPVKLLAEHMGVSSQLALYHLRRLSAKNLVTLQRQGMRLRVYPPSNDGLSPTPAPPRAGE